MSDRKKQLVFNIIEFLRASAEDGTVKEDDKESLEVAVQCIAESFGVDPESDADRAAYSIAPASLLNLLDVFLKTKAKSVSSDASASASSSAPAPASATPAAALSADAKARAEALKKEGNALMSDKLYDGAIEKYTQAIALDENPVYYSNRAAAYGALGEHERAVEDAQSALDRDPTFSKAFSRLGHAQFSLGNYADAVDAYESGLELDPANANMKAALATAKQRAAEAGSNSVADREPPRAGAGSGAGGMPDLSSLAGMFGGGGAGAGGGGMPDLASMMQNPQMMAMAQQMMANGGLERLMSNPTLRRMADNMQNGGGMPDMSQLANDPSMRDLASQFMGGRGGQ
ncbi:Small glutamine-rich tetratricopeptide repeat-containing protein 2 [Cryptotrichosporon argae]